MPKKSNATYVDISAVRRVAKRCAIISGIAVTLLVTGMALGIIYAYGHPADIDIHGTCDVKIPEFLMPSAT